MLRTLVAVSETGSITAAADRVGRSPGAVSATVQQFEEELGIQVFVRKPAKGMAVTSYGKLLVLEAKGLLAHADEFRSIAGALGSSLHGDITVGCFTNLAPMLLAGLIAGFKEHFPGINVHILVGDQETLLHGLHSGTIELAISFDIGLTDALAATPLATMPPRAVLPPSHPLAAAPELSLADLVDQPFVLMDLPYTREYFLSIFHALGLKPRIAYRSQSFETIRTLVGNGLGYSLLNLRPETDQTYDGTSVVHVPIRENLQPLQIVLLTLKSLTRRSIVHTFKEYAAGYLRSRHRG
ncbi:LysR substrate-binding domain-containing protein [Stutzerimonas azotifigens]|uniref:LysR substrate-binding domain-containing protein n=1 Tax=Stutzerimonas azotifigens TaxID=291995 RepID=UPI000A004908|nr:LysR substrate-binding domain-containing protein [Stutzerimonas azotifigens]